MVATAVGSMVATAVGSGVVIGIGFQVGNGFQTGVEGSATDAGSKVTTDVGSGVSAGISVGVGVAIFSPSSTSDNSAKLQLKVNKLTKSKNKTTFLGCVNNPIIELISLHTSFIIYFLFRFSFLL